MSPTTPATVSNFVALQANADYADEMAQSFFKELLALRRRLLLLKICERHAGYANLPLCITAKALASCQLKLMRKCLATVVRVQKGLKKCKKEMKAWVKKEKALHKSFNDMAM
jgi:hypothetical protein